MTLHRRITIVLGCLAYALTVAVVLGHSYNVAVGVFAAHLSVIAAFILCGPLARRSGSPEMRNLLLAAMLATVAAAFLRYWIDFYFYEGVADSGIYSSEGHRLSQLIRSGDLTPDLGGAFVGTRFISLITGYVYTVTGFSPITAFLAFSWLSVVGLYCFYLAFRVVYPAGRHRVLALLLFFLPSLTVWTRGVGKDAWMAFALGVTTLGFAKVTIGHAKGALLATVGLACAAVVRPHVALLLAVSLFGGYFIRRRRRPRTRRRPVISLVFSGALLLLVLASVSLVEKQFRTDSLNASTAVEVFARTEVNTSYGGSEFGTSRPNSLTGLPVAFATVLFRPFLTEAKGAPALASALEGTFLLLLVAMNARRVKVLLRGNGRTALAAGGVCFWLFFTLAFSSLSNFGLLVRQRTQVLPFVLLVVVAAMGQGRSAWRAGEEQLVTAVRAPETVS